ncbi:MAG: bifunctional (p)ppGpp synthetase/guanosine-3',5'-bis(diphosphate) 3'-pyrophosphohydrolase [Clostridia bacterium]|nr:bifunctional (p)ppGpp synthetase/guanosine-3',5'-bis(diphosphate) 3'-pyrophosphohydrolase [Clostridia bacterium]
MTKITIDENELIEKVKHVFSGTQCELVLSAFAFAKEKHEGQFRLSGEPYIIHPCHVANILLDLGMDAETVAAGFLHDVIEDTDATHEILEERFGAGVTMLVEGVTKLNKLQFKSKEQAQAENLRKMLLAMAKDVRVIIIKFADRLHNMRSLSYKPEESRQAIAQETMDIYAPLAARLGMSQIKGELEDLSMRYLYPKEYYELVDLISSKKEERDDFVRKVSEELKAKLDEQLGIPYEINGRSKHFYSIYRKMKRQQSSIDQIYDLMAIRIIVDTVKDCYNVLGIVHSLWTPLPGRFKDYIAMPKANMYQSLHTTVLNEFGAPFEVQIRTKEMHRLAEYGIAAHWKYKDGKTDRTLDEKIKWIREVMALHESDVEDSQEYVAALKTEMFNDEVFVFTPRGDVINLPAGSTVVDFAYAIHSDVGNKCTGGKINMKIVSLSTKLKTGDIVEIITSASAKPSRDWLRFVASPSTKARIRQYFKRTMREENVRIGRDMLIAACKKAGYSAKELMVESWIYETAERQSFSSADDVLAAVGCGELKPKQIIDKLVHRYLQTIPKEEAKQTVVRKPSSSGNNVLIDGEDGMQVHLCKCCNPLPGDRIIGYVTRGRGINVHRADCKNVTELENDRLIKAEWSGVVAGKFSVTLVVFADETSAINKVTELFSSMNVELTHIAAAVDKDKKVKIEVTAELAGREELISLKNKLMQIKSVTDVVRG